MLIDLQVHSTYSDGYMTPTQLAKFLHDKGVKVASLTDHNTVGGQEEFKSACRKNKIKAVPGMELYTKFEKSKVNILWYNYKENDPELHKLLRSTHVRRRSLVRKVLEELVKKGFKLEVDGILDKYSRYVPVNHMVDELLAVPFNLKRIKKELKIDIPKEEMVIKEYFKNKDIQVLRNAYISIDRLFKLRKKIGGQLIYCHPAKHGFVKFSKLSKLKAEGLDGVEVLSPHHNFGATMYLQRLSRFFDFIGTAGSDFHKVEGCKFPIQNCYDYFSMDSKYLRNVKKIIG